MRKLSFRSPDALLIVAVVLLVAVAMTWIVPAGAFDRVERDGRTYVVPGTYHAVEPAPVSPLAFFTAPLRGFTDHQAAEIIAFVLLIGGAFSLLTATGAVDAFLYRVLAVARRNKALRGAVIPLLMIFFSLGGCTFGMAEEVLVFVLITIPLARSMGWDTLVGVAIPFVGAGVGFAGAAFNPFTVGIAQGIAELPFPLGWEYRMVVWAVLTAIATLFVMRYARRIERDPEASLMNGRDDGGTASGELREVPLTARRAVVLLLFMASLVLLVLGANSWGWYILEIAGLFTALGVLAAIVGGVGGNAAAKAYVHGAKDMIPAVLLIALSRSILLVLQDGRTIDTVLHALSGLVEGLPAAVSVQVMYVTQFAINFFVPSGSGQAALTMPVMTPLGDLLGIPRQAAVLAYQLGDGLCNFIIPTSGVTMGILAIGGIPFGTWLRWIGRLMALLVLAGAVLLAIGTTVVVW